MKKESKTNSKSKSTIILIILLLLVLLTVVFYNTFAKYTSSITGSDEVYAAKWSFEVNGDEIAVLGTKPTIDIDLFKTIKDTDINETELDTSNKLAPGTSGSFTLNVKNTSDVTTQYTIALEVVGADNLPLEYKIDNGDWTSSLSSIEASDATKLAAKTETTTAEKDIVVSWRWAFSDDNDADKDAKDTAVGIAIRNGDIDKVKVNATVTAVQVD